MRHHARFQSFLGPDIDQFLAHKRSLGRRYDVEEKTLALLDAYLVNNHIGRAVQRSLLWWHGPGESEMPHTDANRPVIANWWFPRRGAI